MPLIRSLALLPFVGILVGTPFLNRATPLILGLPLLFAWQLLWIVLASIIMLVIYRCDPANRTQPPGTEPKG
jgi:xanthosine utilization system XapX-like protein